MDKVLHPRQEPADEVHDEPIKKIKTEVTLIIQDCSIL
jgi:hypothetical protein